MHLPVENTHARRLIEWTSWTSFARNELGAPHRWGSQYILGHGDFEHPLDYELICKILAEKMDHESSVFGLPPTHIEFETLLDRDRQIELKRRCYGSDWWVFRESQN